LRIKSPLTIYFKYNKEQKERGDLIIRIFELFHERILEIRDKNDKI